MGTERQNPLARKVVTFEQSRNRHRDTRPPVGVTDDNRFVIGPLLCVGLFLEGRARLFVLVVLRLLQDGIVVVGIGLHEFKFHHVETSLLLDFAGDTAGIPAPGIENNQRTGTAFRVRRRLHLFALKARRFLSHKSSLDACTRIHSEPEPHIVTLAGLLHGPAIGTAEVLAEIVPAATAMHAPRARRFARRIDRHACRAHRNTVIAVKVKAPFAHVPVNVVKPEGIGLEFAHGERVPAVNAGAGFQNLVVEIVLLDLIRIMPVKIHIVGTGSLLCVERRGRAASGRVFPFRFGGEPVAVRLAIPADRIAFDSVNGSASIAFA